MSVPGATRQAASRNGLILRLFRERLSLRTERRYVTFVLATSVFCLLVAAVSMGSGRYAVPISGLWSAFWGVGDQTASMIVIEWRLPRMALALLLGAALGMSGAIFQSLTRNPLGSPDVIGFSAGSYTGALVVIILLPGGYYGVAAGALVGGIATALAVYSLAWKNGIHGFRLIIIGIGVAAMLSSFNAWMIREADLQIAMAAAIWGAGSLNGLGTDELKSVAAVLSILAPAALFLSRPMRQLEMGDDIAAGSGVSPGRVRLCLMIVGVSLTATVTAAAGPISFIALAAPQMARRLSGSAGIALLSSAGTGAALLLAADWAAQHAFAIQLPVGAMTVSIGGLYFIWLLIREGRA